MSDLESSLTWQFDINNFNRNESSPDLNNRALLFNIKQALVGFSLSPWTVQGSSNSSAAGHDAVDRWTTASNVVWAANGVAHSWIDLKQTGLGSNFQMLIDCTNASAALTVQISPSVGFSGGTTANRPTASDSITLILQGAWGGQDTGSGQVYSSIMHAMQSEDGYGTNVIITRGNGPTSVTPKTGEGGVPCGFWHIGKAKNPIAEWTFPIVAVVAGATSLTGFTPGSGRGASSVYTDTSVFSSVQSSTTIALRATVEGFGSNLLLNTLPTQNEIDGIFPVYPVGLYSTTAGYRGRLGELQDIWFAPLEYLHSTAYEDGYGNPRQFMQFENLVLPWNGQYLLGM